MLTDPSAPQRRALGVFLRSCRERQDPRDFSLPIVSRRRTPGLRREEVAQLCGISATWLTWIEQGREVSASPPALSRLAQVLSLSAAERAYLFQLAAKHDPNEGLEIPSIDGLESIALALRDMAYPAYLLDRFWTLQAWNDQANHLFRGWLDQAGDRNLLRYVFLNPAAPHLIEDWQQRARRLLAEFRADSSRHLTDPGLQALVAELCQNSDFFAQAWASQAVMGRDGGERRFNHPIDGPLRFEQLTFALARNTDLKLVMLVR